MTWGNPLAIIDTLDLAGVRFARVYRVIEDDIVLIRATVLHLLDEWDDSIRTRRMACGIVGKLPLGDQYVEDEIRAAAHLGAHPEKYHCHSCFGDERPTLGTPISQLSGRPGHDGFDEFCRIARSWGHD